MSRNSRLAKILTLLTLIIAAIAILIIQNEDIQLKIVVSAGVISFVVNVWGEW